MSAYMEPDDFAAWVKGASPSDRKVYYIGHLCYDRETIINVAGPGKPVRLAHIFNSGPDQIGKAAWRAYENGYVMLVQRRLDAYSHEYVAIRTKKRMKK